MTQQPFFPPANGPEEMAPLAPVATMPAPQPTSRKRQNTLLQQHQNALNRLLGLLRDVRAEAQNFQQSLADIKLKSELIEKQVRATELEAALKESNAIFKCSCDLITDRRKWIQELIQKEPMLYDWAGDEITHIDDSWQRVLLNWPEAERLDGDKVIPRIGKVSDLLDGIVLQIGKLTIPSRVNKHLDELRIGQTLDFHEEFLDELPKLADQRKVLSFLHSHSRAISGVVDAENGVIYKASRKLWRQLLSIGFIVGVIALGALLIFLVDRGLGLSIRPAMRWPGDLVGYLALIVGGIAHIAIDAIKQARINNREDFRALDDWFLWIHVKEVSIISGVLSLWIGFIALVVFAGPKQDVDWQMAFFVGYSIDSFIDIFLQRFSKITSANTEALKGLLG